MALGVRERRTEGDYAEFMKNVADNIL